LLVYFDVMQYIIYEYAHVRVDADQFTVGYLLLVICFFVCY